MTLMKNISIGTKGKPIPGQTSKRCRKKKVEATLFLPGLFLNKPPVLAVADKMVNITHSTSGFAIAQHVPIHLLTEVRSVLIGTDWRRPSQEIYNCPIARAAGMEVKEIVARDKSKEQEKRLAKLLGGRVQPGSGRIANYRRDVVSKSALVEAKITSTDKYVLSVVDFDALKYEARKQGKFPVYVIEFENIGSDGYMFCVLELDDFFLDSPDGDVEEVRLKDDVVTVTINKNVAKSIVIDDKVFVYDRGGNLGKLLLCSVELTLNLVNQD